MLWIFILFVVIVGNIYYYFFRNIVFITKNNHIHFNQQLISFETNMKQRYPLTPTSTFRITHGKVYADFFMRMGQMLIIAYMHNNTVIGTACGVWRKIYVSDQMRYHNIIYICDLKVLPNFRRQGISTSLYYAGMLAYVCFVRKAYALIMKPTYSTLEDVPSYRFALKLGFSFHGWINIYKVDQKTLKTILLDLLKWKGGYIFTDISASKNLIEISSAGTESILPIWHMHFSKQSHNLNDKNIRDTHHVMSKDPKTQYMFCFHEKDPITTMLVNHRIKPWTHAGLIQRGMDEWQPSSFDFIQTSEI